MDYHFYQIYGNQPPLATIFEASTKLVSTSSCGLYWQINHKCKKFSDVIETNLAIPFIASTQKFVDSLLSPHWVLPMGKVFVKVEPRKIDLNNFNFEFEGKVKQPRICISVAKEFNCLQSFLFHNQFQALYDQFSLPLFAFTNWSAPGIDKYQHWRQLHDYLNVYPDRVFPFDRASFEMSYNQMFWDYIPEHRYYCFPSAYRSTKLFDLCCNSYSALRHMPIACSNGFVFHASTSQKSGTLSTNPDGTNLNFSCLAYTWIKHTGSRDHSSYLDMLANINAKLFIDDGIMSVNPNCDLSAYDILTSCLDLGMVTTSEFEDFGSIYDADFLSNKFQRLGSDILPQATQPLKSLCGMCFEERDVFELYTALCTLELDYQHVYHDGLNIGLVVSKFLDDHSKLVPAHIRGLRFSPGQMRSMLRRGN